MYHLFAIRVSVIAFFLCLVYSAKVIPERADIEYANDKYVENAKFYVKRYGRKSGYYINVEGTTKHVWNNNVTFHFIFYEFLHNEYRRSFIEIHHKACDLLENDAYLGKMLEKVGLTCPIYKGDHLLLNMTVPMEAFPNVFPFERTMVEVLFTVTATEELMVRAHIYVLIKKK